MRTTLRTATGQGVAALWARFDRFTRRVSERPMELAWHRPTPLVVVRDRTSRSEMTMNVTASLRLAWNQTVLGREPATPPPAVTVMRPAVVMPRLETRIERDRLESRIVPSATPAPPPPPVLPVAAERPTTPAVPPITAPPVPPTRLVMPAPRVAMILAPAAQTVAANAVAAATRTVDARGQTPAQHASASVPPELRIDRITTEVVRVLDSRLLAFRERMGDR